MNAVFLSICAYIGIRVYVHIDVSIHVSMYLDISISIHSSEPDFSDAISLRSRLSVFSSFKAGGQQTIQGISGSSPILRHAILRTRHSMQ
jgi:hypothetical protein